ncbi:MAG: LysR family transcriptional regulator [Clostridia bacterium]|nr:LysR family transcriptional regulator [Clostridia bacterium]
MNDKQIAAFISVADCGSFSAAARKQYISPQAMIQQIDLLEKEVCVQLLNRTHRGVTLTEAGKQFYTGVLNIAKQLDDLLEQVRKTQELDKLSLRIGVFDSSPVTLPICRSFAAKYPEIRQKYYVIQPEDWLDDLNLLYQNKLDLFEHADVPEIHQTGLRFLPLLNDRCSIILHPSHPLAAREIIYPSDLANQTIGIHDKACVKGLEEFLAQHVPNAVLISEKHGPVSSFDICAAGGVFLVSQSHAARYRPLSAIPFECSLTWSFGIIYKEPPSALVQLFIDNAKAAYPQ